MYTVVATDADGVQLTGAAQVRVNLLMTAISATPATVLPGQQTQLDTAVIGGDGTYNFLWSPAASLSDPRIRNPIASPTVSTDYTVVVTNGQGESLSATVHVTVAPATTLTAAFSFTRGALDPVARTIHWTFDASASTGPIATYGWHLTRTDGTTVLDIVSATPVLEVDLPETVARGNATLTITAVNGATATITQAFR